MGGMIYRIGSESLYTAVNARLSVHSLDYVRVKVKQTFRHFFSKSASIFWFFIFFLPKSYFCRVGTMMLYYSLLNNRAGSHARRVCMSPVRRKFFLIFEEIITKRTGLVNMLRKYRNIGKAKVA